LVQRRPFRAFRVGNPGGFEPAGSLEIYGDSLYRFEATANRTIGSRVDRSHAGNGIPGAGTSAMSSDAALNGTGKIKEEETEEGNAEPISVLLPCREIVARRCSITRANNEFVQLAR